MQVDPGKPKLKSLGTKRLKPKCDILVSTSAFKFNLRRYNKAMEKGKAKARKMIAARMKASVAGAAGIQAGAYTRPLISST